MSLEHLNLFFSEEENKSIQEPQEEEIKEYSPILTAHIERDKKSRALYFEMADNIKESEKLRSRITKDIKAARPKEDILLMAIECIGLMTGDKVFYNQNIKELIKR